jgi:hypothetical protein
VAPVLPRVTLMVPLLTLNRVVARVPSASLTLIALPLASEAYRAGYSFGRNACGGSNAPRQPAHVRPVISTRGEDG